jgi:hypothetical protein
LSRRAKCSNGVDSAHDITGRDRGLGRLQRAYRIGVTEHRNCLFEAGQVVGADEHDRWAAVAGDDHAFMFVLDTVDVFREAIFYRSKGLGAHGYNCATAGRRWATVGPGTTMSSLVASPASQVAQNAQRRTPASDETPTGPYRRVWRVQFDVGRRGDRYWGRIMPAS